MSHFHVPILAKEILSFAEEIPQGVENYLDGTFGRGGHFKKILEKWPKVKAVVVDKDVDAVDYAKKEFQVYIQSGQVDVLHGDYTQIKNLLSQLNKTQLFDMILLDLGISSPQIDNPDRGFSFLHEGPLDMRMNRHEKLNASDIVNNWSEEDLAQLFKNYGEVNNPNRVVRAIIHDRKDRPFTTTTQLAEMIARVEGWKKKGYHPATQYFMALRIQVNGELENLETALIDCIQLLNDKGRLFVITFHSLEDRIVKEVFNNSHELGAAVNKRVIVPDTEEEKANPRSRSAKLRIFERSYVPVVKGKKDKYAHKKGH